MTPPSPERSHLSIREVLDTLVEEFPDVTISKIRFLESRGLIHPERTAAGYRRFYHADVERLRWILRQQREHFLPLKVIKGRLERNAPFEPSLFDDVADDEVGELASSVPTAESHGASGAARLAGAESGATLHTLSFEESRNEQGCSELARAGEARAEQARLEEHRAEELAQAGEARLLAGDGPRRAGEHRLLASAGRSALATAGTAGNGYFASGRVGLGSSAPQPPAMTAPLPAHGPRAVAASSGPSAGSGGATGSDPTDGDSTDGDPTGSGATGSDPTGGDPTGSGSGENRPSGARRATRGARGSEHVAAGAAAEMPAASPASAASRAGAPRARSENAPAAVGGQPAQPDTGDAPQAPARVGSTARGIYHVISGASFSGEELATAAGVEPSVIDELVEYGLIAGRDVAGVRVYDEDALVVASAAGAFRRFGIEGRHLKTLRHAAEREASLYSQVVTPLLRQRNPQSHERALGSLEQMSELGASLREHFLRAELRRLTGG